jgi:hypothetical protein
MILCDALGYVYLVSFSDNTLSPILRRKSHESAIRSANAQYDALCRGILRDLHDGVHHDDGSDARNLPN